MKQSDITVGGLSGAKLIKVNPIMKYFKYDHLKGNLLMISKPLCEMAIVMNAELPNGPEKSAGLRKLLEAKDCFVRAGL